MKYVTDGMYVMEHSVNGKTVCVGHGPEPEQMACLVAQLLNKNEENPWTHPLGNPTNPVLYAELAMGMTKREIFAALALAGMMVTDNEPNYGHAVQQADALLAELNKEPKNETK